MADKVLITDLLLRTIIGVNPDEREKLQDVIINVVLEADTRAAGESDDLTATVNYRTVAKQITEMVETSRFFLVEKMAAEIARICLSEPHVLRATVRVEKPGALRFARSVGVEIVRAREERPA
ncbi:MAG: dihydroneopterin aldolase [Chloroflexota bacterium]